MRKPDPYERGRNDCTLDDMENAQFSSTGGLDARDSMKPPWYINENEREAYLNGYKKQAESLYGNNWKTCEFTWKCVMVINDTD